MASIEKERVFLMKHRSNQIAGVRQIEQWLEFPSSIVDRKERDLVFWLRDNGIHFDDALKILKSHYNIS